MSETIADLEFIMRKQIQDSEKDFRALYNSGLATQTDVERKYRSRLGQRMGGIVVGLIGRKGAKSIAGLGEICASDGLSAAIDEVSQLAGISDTTFIIGEVKRMIESKDDLPTDRDWS